jgi:hypothetical protein
MIKELNKQGYIEISPAIIVVCRISLLLHPKHYNFSKGKKIMSICLQKESSETSSGHQTTGSSWESTHTGGSGGSSRSSGG